MSEQAPPIAVVGCDFRVAGAAWRSALVLDKEERASLLGHLRDAAGVVGLVTVDTCNRTEWLVESEQAEWTADLLRSWMQRRWKETHSARELPEPSVHLREDAVRHVLRVAVGLESFAAGEREIAFQLRRSLERARSEGTMSPALSSLGQAAARTVRRVERQCSFRDSRRGVHALALQCVREGLPNVEAPRIAVAGLGQIGRRVVSWFTQQGHAPACRFNRTANEAAGISPLDELPRKVRDMDVLVVATGARRAVVDCDELAEGRARPLLVLDLGIPAQVASPTDETVPIRVAGLDDILKESAAGSTRDGSEDLLSRAAAEAEVESGLHDYLLARSKGPAGSLLRALQESRDRFGKDDLPHLLSEQLGELAPERRRRLEESLRGLILERDRLLVEEIESLLAPSDTPPSPSPEHGAEERA